MSQRRARGWCRIQCAVYRDWDPELLVSMLTDEALAAEASGMERATATELLAGAVQTVEDLDALWQALVEALST